MSKSLLETTIEYCGGLLANLTKTDKTANGVTDDKEPENPPQVEQIMAASTDARPAANVLFASKVRIPAEILVTGDFYDATQAFTRTNSMYTMTRKDYYDQAITYRILRTFKN